MFFRWVGCLVMACGACAVDVDVGGAVPVGFVGLRPYTTLPTSNETAAGVSWASAPGAYRGRNGLRIKYDCPADGAPGSLWGSDIYTDDSSVCTAGVHFGRITTAVGGSIVIEIRAGRSSYTGLTRNGVMSSNYGNWGGSFIVL